MNILDPTTYTKSVSALVPLSRASIADFTSIAVDTTGYSGGWAKVVFYAGALDNAVTLTGVVQESATSGGSYANIAQSGFTITTTSDDNTVVVGVIRLPTRLPFLKVVMTHAASANACVYSVVVELSRPDRALDSSTQPARFATL